MPQHFRVYDGSYPHFVTNTIIYWIPVFCRSDYFGVLVDSLNYCIEHKGLQVHAYVLMPNHFHGVCTQTDGDLPGVMRDLKRHTSTQIGRKLQADGRLRWLRAFENAGSGAGHPKIWDDEFHPEQVHSQDFFDQKVRYMHENPLRAGYVDDPSHWKYSSAGFYYSDRPSVVPITPILW